MSEPTPLTNEQVHELRGDLEQLQVELASFLAGSASASRPVALDEPIGRISRQDALQQQSMTKAGRTAAEQRVQRVEAALRRIATDVYGHCLECEEPVGYERLKAQPDAVLCIACQGEREVPA